MHNPAFASLKPNLCVFIGRFEPLHAGHCRVIQEGLDKADHLVVLVGSANEPRTFRNPFNTAERVAMIQETFGHHPRLKVLPLENSEYDLNEWIERTQRTVDQAWADLRAGDPSLPKRPQVALIGHAKDATSYYLNLFPRWSSLNVPHHHLLSATDIREKLFGNLAMIRPELDAAFLSKLEEAIRKNQLEELLRQMAGITTDAYLERYTTLAQAQARAYLAAQRAAGEQAEVPSSVLTFLEDFVGTEGYLLAAYEYAFVAKYHYAWRFAPYSPTFATADAVVLQSAHVLMVKRKYYPGKGLWALPGGFVDAGETFETAGLRELEEETGLKVPPAILKGSIQARELFDDPNRSSRGRTITCALAIALKPGPLPKTKKVGAADDGDEETLGIAWRSLADLRREECFEDHYSIAKKMSRLASQ